MADKAPAHIVVVDDDPKVRLLLRRCLEEEGYNIDEAADRSDLNTRMSAGPVDLITLDLNLAGDDGLAITREIRSRSNIPIIMVTGKGDTIDRVIGLEMGADDYIAKPFHVREVLARVRSVLRRSDAQSATTDSEISASPAACYRFAGWTIDFDKWELKAADGSEQSLTTSEFHLLEVFVMHSKRVLSRDRIMDLLKGHDWSPLDRSIDNQVSRLRKRIEIDPENPKLIKTVRGVGYTFTASVEKT